MLENKNTHHSDPSPHLFLSWAERKGFAHWGLALLWLILVLVLFQVIASVVLAGVLMYTGEAVRGFDVEDFLAQHTNLLFIANTTGQVLTMGLATFLIVQLHRSNEKTAEFLRIKWHPDSFGYIFYGAILILVFQPVVIYLGYVNSLVPLPDLFSEFQVSQYQMIENFLQSDGVLLFGLLHIAVVPAICEEVLFRGYILKAFEKSWGIVTAVVVSGILFGLFHIQFGNLLPLASLGIILALMTWLSGSLWPAIVAHFMNNGSAVIIGIYYPEMMFRDISAEVLPPLWVLFASIVFSVIIIYTMINRSNHT